MLDTLIYIATGGLIGLFIGLTGVGGGALMTPALLFFGFPAHIAIGTDLWYAALTKSTGLISHHKQKHIKWRIAINMAIGSLPAAIATGVVLTIWFKDPGTYSTILKSALGVMLIATALVLFLRKKISALTNKRTIETEESSPISLKIILMGAVLGVLVTLSSVGAGAVGTAVLMLVYPYLLPKQIVGTDIAHAVPLTLVAGIVHLYLGNVDFLLLISLLLGSLPAVKIGAALSGRIPSKLLHPALASLLMILGMKYAIF